MICLSPWCPYSLRHLRHLPLTTKHQAIKAQAFQPLFYPCSVPLQHGVVGFTLQNARHSQTDDGAAVAHALQLLSYLGPCNCNMCTCVGVTLQNARHSRIDDETALARLRRPSYRSLHHTNSATRHPTEQFYKCVSASASSDRACGKCKQPKQHDKTQTLALT